MQTKEEGGQRTEEGGQRTEDRGRGTGRRTEEGGQRAEERGQRKEDRGRRTQEGGQRKEETKQILTVDRVPDNIDQWLVCNNVQNKRRAWKLKTSARFDRHHYSVTIFISKKFSLEKT